MILSQQHQTNKDEKTKNSGKSAVNGGSERCRRTTNVTSVDVASAPPDQRVLHRTSSLPAAAAPRDCIDPTNNNNDDDDDVSPSWTTSTSLADGATGHVGSNLRAGVESNPHVEANTQRVTATTPKSRNHAENWNHHRFVEEGFEDSAGPISNRHAKKNNDSTDVNTKIGTSSNLERSKFKDMLNNLEDDDDFDDEEVDFGNQSQISMGNKSATSNKRRNSMMSLDQAFEKEEQRAMLQEANHDLKLLRRNDAKSNNHYDDDDNPDQSTMGNPHDDVDGRDHTGGDNDDFYPVQRAQSLLFPPTSSLLTSASSFEQQRVLGTHRSKSMTHVLVPAQTSSALDGTYNPYNDDPHADMDDDDATNNRKGTGIRYAFPNRFGRDDVGGEWWDDMDGGAAASNSSSGGGSNENEPLNLAIHQRNLDHRSRDMLHNAKNKNTVSNDDGFSRQQPATPTYDVLEFDNITMAGTVASSSTNGETGNTAAVDKDSKAFADDELVKKAATLPAAELMAMLLLQAVATGNATAGSLAPNSPRSPKNHNVSRSKLVLGGKSPPLSPLVQQKQKQKKSNGEHDESLDDTDHTSNANSAKTKNSNSGSDDGSKEDNLSKGIDRANGQKSRSVEQKSSGTQADTSQQKNSEWMESVLSEPASPKKREINQEIEWVGLESSTETNDDENNNFNTDCNDSKNEHLEEHLTEAMSTSTVTTSPRASKPSPQPSSVLHSSISLLPNPQQQKNNTTSGSNALASNSPRSPPSSQQETRKQASLNMSETQTSRSPRSHLQKELSGPSATRTPRSPASLSNPQDSKHGRKQVSSRSKVPAPPMLNLSVSAPIHSTDKCIESLATESEPSNMPRRPKSPGTGLKKMATARAKSPGAGLRPKSPGAGLRPKSPGAGLRPKSPGAALRPKPKEVGGNESLDDLQKSDAAVRRPKSSGPIMASSDAAAAGGIDETSAPATPIAGNPKARKKRVIKIRGGENLSQEQIQQALKKVVVRKREGSRTNLVSADDGTLLSDATIMEPSGHQSGGSLLNDSVSSGLLQQDTSKEVKHANSSARAMRTTHRTRSKSRGRSSEAPRSDSAVEQPNQSLEQRRRGRSPGTGLRHSPDPATSLTTAEAGNSTSVTKRPIRSKSQSNRPSTSTKLAPGIARVEQPQPQAASKQNAGTASGPSQQEEKKQRMRSKSSSAAMRKPSMSGSIETISTISTSNNTPPRVKRGIVADICFSPVRTIRTAFQRASSTSWHNHNAASQHSSEDSRRNSASSATSNASPTGMKVSTPAMTARSLHQITSTRSVGNKKYVLDNSAHSSASKKRSPKVKGGTPGKGVRVKKSSGVSSSASLSSPVQKRASSVSPAFRGRSLDTMPLPGPPLSGDGAASVATAPAMPATEQTKLRRAKSVPPAARQPPSTIGSNVVRKKDRKTVINSSQHTDSSSEVISTGTGPSLPAIQINPNNGGIFEIGGGTKALGDVNNGGTGGQADSIVARVREVGISPEQLEHLKRLGLQIAPTTP